MRKQNNIRSKERSISSNILYVISLIWKYQKSALLCMVLISLFNSALPVFGIILPKLIIDEMSGVGRTDVIAKIIVYGFAFVFLSKTIVTLATNAFSQTTIWFKMIIISGKKYMTMDFALTDDPEMLNLNERAESVLKNAGEGILGVISKLFDLSGILITFILSFLIVSSLKIWIVLIFMTITMLNYLIELKFAKKNVELDKKYPLFTRKLRYFTEWMQEYQYGKDLRLYGLKGLAQQKYKDNLNHIKMLDKDRMLFSMNKGLIFGFVSLINEVILYAYLVYRFLDTSITIGDFTMYVIAIRTFCSVFNDMILHVARIRYLSTGVGVIRDFLDYDMQKENYQTESVDDDNGFVIKFISVCFKYPNQQEYVLKDINLTIDSKEKLVLVGMNGAGKTTFIKLLMGLYQPSSGAILINGINTKNIDKSSLFKLFSVVFQETELFAMTLAENVSMQPHIKTNLDLATKCLERVGLTDMLNSLPDKMETQILKNINQGGLDFSGGQKQRIAIARALYKDSPILILDEPTAALDAFAENEIYSYFSDMANQKTCIFISHRLSSVVFCDKALLLEHGEISEYGTHAELIKKEGKYFELFSLQSQYYKSDAVKNERGENE